MGKLQIFISAVSNEFEGYRTELRRYLEQHDVSVKIQQDMGASGVATVDQLADYVKSSDGVVHLVGEQPGSPINADSLAWLQRHYSPLASPFHSLSEVLDGTTAASYTQWEAYLALIHGKELVVMQAAPTAPRSHLPEEPKPVQSQANHLQRLRDLGRYPAKPPFGNADQLVAQVVTSTLYKKLAQGGQPLAPKLPYNPLGKLFKGREPFMKTLRAKFLDPGSGNCKALRGMGGIGKTRLAVEYAWQHQQDYTALLFVSADVSDDASAGMSIDTAAGLEANMAGLSGLLVPDLQGANAQEQEVRLRAVLKWLADNPGWLLILDNLDTEPVAAAVEKLLPQLATGHVLLTTRLRRWSKQVECLELDVLSEEDATAFLLERTDGERRPASTDAADARALAHDLGQLALALEQAGAYIVDLHSSLATYRQRWASNEKNVRHWFNPQLMKYPRSVAVTWQTSFDQLSAQGRALLNRLAWLAPAPIPLSLLEVATPDAEPLDTEEALAELARYSLATYTADGEAFAVHLLVQDITRRSPEILPAETFREALSWVNTAFAGNPQDVRTWPVLAPLRPHALEVAMQYAPTFGNPEPTGTLLNNLGQLLAAKAELRAAEPLMRRALTIDEQSYGPDHPDVATCLNNLAELLRATNRLTEAEPLMRRALAIDEQRYAPDHPNVAPDLSNLAGLLRDTNRLTEAEPLFRRALAIDEQSYGPNHPNVATCLNNLAGLLQATNRLTEAEPLFRRALAIDEQSYGPDHPYVATRLNNLAELLRATNRLVEAEPLFRRALAIDEQSYGPDHPTVAIPLNNLAGLLEATNRLAEAETLYYKAIVILIGFYQHTHHMHPNFQTTVMNYVGLLHQMGQTEQQIRDTLGALGILLEA